MKQRYDKKQLKLLICILADWVSVEGHKPGSSDKNWSSFFAIGPMVRYASDLPLLLTVISQTDEARIGFNKKVRIFLILI